ncbi:T9SS type A sorting domain-containing protein [Lewinella sp. LCG006]|uniref:DUF7619 domain-containing protein n=1 Tax=Lewinella sp. LCG006 TaxID=3231911 RepID=UPI0034610E7C
MKSFSLAFALIFLSFCLFSQVTWDALPNGPYGMSTNKVLTGPEESVFLLGVSEQLVSRSLDGGENWTQLFPTEQVAISGFVEEITAGADGTLGIIVNGDVLIIGLEETEWTYFPGINARNLAISADGTIVIITNNHQIHYLPPGESTWTNVMHSESSLFGELTALPNQAFILWWEGSIRRFSLVDNSLEVIYTNGTVLDDVKAHPSAGIFVVVDNTLFHSNDYGDTWNTLPTTAEMEFNQVFFGGDGRIYLMIDRFLDPQHHASTDGGQSWNPSTALLQETFSAPSSVVLSDDSEIFYYEGFCHEQLLIKTIDDGLSYSDLSRAFRYTTIEILTNPADDILFVGACNLDLQYSTNGGEDWQNYPRPNGQPVEYIREGTLGGLLALTITNELLLSTNLGEDWTDITPLGLGNGGINEAYIYDADHILAFQTFGNTFYTADGGANWTIVATPENIVKAVVHPDGYFFGFDPYLPDDDEDFIYRFNPQTLSWEVTNFPYGVAELHCTKTGVLLGYYVGPNQQQGADLLVSYDLGENFDVANNVPYRPRLNQLNAFPMVSNRLGHIFMISEEKVYRSQDDGFTWEIYYEAIEMDDPVPNYALYIDRNDYLYFYRFILYRTTEPTANPAIFLGHVWLDRNEDCLTQEPEEDNLPGQLIQASNETATYFSYTNSEGDYQLNVPMGDYELKLINTNPLFVACSDPINITVGEDEAITADLAVYSTVDCAWLQPQASTPFLRRCFENIYYVTVCNEGTIASTSTPVTVTLDDFFVFLGSSLPVDNQDGQQYTFTLPALEVGACQTFSINLEVSCDADLGQEHCLQVDIPLANECTMAGLSGSYTECQINIGSYDPNDKRAFVAGREIDTYLLPGTEELSYHIRFQNTGSDTAFTVVVTDTLPITLDPSTFRFENSSHPCETAFRTGEGGLTVLEFTFNDILLVDSMTNEPASHGFVKFAIAPLDSLELGTSVLNFADIFFDFNEPVRTNTSSLLYDFPSGTEIPLSEKYKLHAFPNPFTGQVFFEIQGPPAPEQLLWECFNAQGKLIAKMLVSEKRWNWSGNHLPAGFYIYRLSNREGLLVTEKLIKTK